MMQNAKKKKKKTVFTNGCVGSNPQPLDQEANDVPLCQRSIADARCSFLPYVLELPQLTASMVSGPIICLKTKFSLCYFRKLSFLKVCWSSCLSVCLFVCLFVSLSIFSQTSEPILLKFCTHLGLNPTQTPLKFGRNRITIKIRKN